jgi:hypothetical protein
VRIQGRAVGSSPFPENRANVRDVSNSHVAYFKVFFLEIGNCC